MNLHLPTAGLERYKSAAQRARISTEAWGASNLYCPSCASPTLKSSAPNTAAVDFFCPLCGSLFQLKSQARAIGHKIADAAYSQMRRAILEDRTPNIYVLHYDIRCWAVCALILIPRFAFTLSSLERRKPLSSTAKRAGWIGCNILLSAIPPSARIQIVENGRLREAHKVRQEYLRLRALENIGVETRGWTLDVLNVVYALQKPEFHLSEVYEHTPTLSRLHPKNAHVRDKIRQQLQVLRDLGFIVFLGSGIYRLV